MVAGALAALESGVLVALVVLVIVTAGARVALTSFLVRVAPRNRGTCQRDPGPLPQVLSLDVMDLLWRVAVRAVLSLEVLPRPAEVAVAEKAEKAGSRETLENTESDPENNAHHWIQARQDRLADRSTFSEVAQGN